LVSESDNCWGSVTVSCSSEKPLAVAGDVLRTPRKGKVRHLKPLPSNGSEDVNVDTNMRVIVITPCVRESNKSSHQLPTRL
jgi:hypothetical protein